MWDLVEREGEAWIYCGQQPLLQLDPQRDARIVAPARAMTAKQRSKYLMGVVDGWAKRERDRMPPADREGPAWEGGLFR